MQKHETCNSSRAAITSRPAEIEGKRSLPDGESPSERAILREAGTFHGKTQLAGITS